MLNSATLRTRGADFDLKATMHKVIMDTAMKVYHKSDQYRCEDECFTVYNDGAIWHSYDRGPSGKEDFRQCEEVLAPYGHRKLGKILWPAEVFPIQTSYVGFQLGCIYVGSLETAQNFVKMMLEG
jgi:hypothetical protein